MIAEENYEFWRGDFVLGLAVVIPTPTSTCGGPFSSKLLLGFYMRYVLGSFASRISLIKKRKLKG